MLKIFITLTLLLFLVSSSIAASVNVIIDTDNDSDMGDPLALSVANYLMNKGEVNILAMVTDTASVHSTAAAQAINTYYGNANIIMGSCDSGCIATQHSICDAVNSALPSAIKSAGNQTQSAVSVLRMILAKQPNNSVVYIGIGLERNIYNLYNSPADSFSSMTGAQLITAKISRFVIMGGDYGVTYPAQEYNLETDATASQVINNLTSIPVYWIGYSLGNSVTDTVNTGNTTPAQIAATAEGSFTRPAWDELTILYAVRGSTYGSETYFTLNGPGTNTVNGSGYNTFTTGPGVQYYLTAAESTTNLGTDLGVMVNASVQTYVGGQMRRVFQSGDIPLRVKQAGDISLHK